MNSQNIMFVILAVLMVLSSIATVLTKSIVRAATYLFFVLLGTAGMYFLMGYTFLGAAQVIVYAGGIIVLYVFSILLTAKDQEIFKRKIKDASWGFVLSLVGFLTFAWVVLSHNFKAAILTAPSETASSVTTIESIGRNMLSSGENGYLLPFEAVSVLLLACIVGALLIARKR